MLKNKKTVKSRIKNRKLNLSGSEPNSKEVSSKHTHRRKKIFKFNKN